ncbi:MAG: hypothetical protein J7M03_00250 [Candidatus Desulfofervidaceae bacterium]|nr:hypothetical protein [Candidatus Desulfofervidaceae bacterium]
MAVTMISTRQTSRPLMEKSHVLAGVLLIGFGISHILFFLTRDIGHDLPNTVFPFLSNRAVILMAAIIEVTWGVICIQKRREILTGILILSFIGILLWYRWALVYTGGKQCDCLGFVGRLLHVSHVQEKIISLGALGLLAFLSFPSCVTLFGARTHRRKASVMRISIMLAALNACMVGKGATVCVWGDVSLEEFNPLTGRVYPKQCWYSTFEARWKGRVWRTAVTNKANRGWWVRQAYDGTNSYTLWRDGRISTNTPHAIVTSTPYPIPAGSGLLGDPLVPITYGWSPATVISNRAGRINMPVPWTVVRRNPEAWGYRWDIGKWVNHRFLESFTVTRDSSLDLRDKKELFRFEIDYPDTLSDYTRYLKILELRRTTPDGWVRARYQVTGWLETNSLTIPFSSRLEVFSTAPKAKWPCRVFKLQAVGVKILDQDLTFPPDIDTELTVADYRYKRWNRKRIFKYAQYVLHQGDEWPGARDPELLAAADNWLKNGREYIRFADDRKRWFAWGALGVLLAPALLVLIQKKRQNRKEER